MASPGRDRGRVSAEAFIGDELAPRIAALEQTLRAEAFARERAAGVRVRVYGESSTAASIELGRDVWILSGERALALLDAGLGRYEVKPRDVRSAVGVTRTSPDAGGVEHNEQHPWQKRRA